MAAIQKFKDILHLDYFPDLDDDLLQMIISSSSLTVEQRQSIEKKYKISPKNMNYQALEFYGDTILSMLIMDELITFVGLNVGPGVLTNIKIKLIQNDTLTFYSRELDYCRTVFDIPDEQRLSKQNICADVFEALLGLLYYTYAFDVIRDWFSTFPTINKFMDEQILPILGESNTILDFPVLRIILRRSQSAADALRLVVKEYIKKYPYIQFQRETIYEGLYGFDVLNTRNSRHLHITTYTDDSDQETFSQRVLDELQEKGVLRVVYINQ